MTLVSRLSIVKETGLSLALSKTRKTGLFCVEAYFFYSRSLLLFLYSQQRFLLDVLRNLNLFQVENSRAAKSIQEQIKC